LAAQLFWYNYNDMRFIIDQKVFLSYPGLQIGVLVVKNANNIASHPEVATLLRGAEKQVRESGKKSVQEFEHIVSWQEAHKKFGNKPKRYAPSVQAVVKRALKDSELPKINTLVDLYNYISLKYIVPVGGEDLDAREGDVKLTYADGNEYFIAIGDQSEDPPKTDEIVYKDDKGVLCRKFNWREADRTKLTGETKNAIIVIEALPSVSRETLGSATDELKSLVEKCCKANVSATILDKDNSALNLE
jgi:DNA/RNA-binding domain of Phe-tRNA-synthetase-like protein